MKHILPLLVIFCLFLGCAEQSDAQKTYTLETKSVAVKLTPKTNRDVYFSSVKNKNTNTDIILKKPSETHNIWTIKVKESKQFMQKETELTGKDSKKFSAKQDKNKLTLTWTDVKDVTMDKGFDVTVTGEIKGEDTLWHIEVDPKSKDYGIWQVNFPNIVFNFEDGQEFFSGIYGGFLENTNPYTSPEGNKRISCQYPSNMPFQMAYVTQKGSGIYLCPEDVEGWHKLFNWPAVSDKEIYYYLTTMPNDQGVGGVKYDQAFKFNISAFDGDWYDAIRRYKAWCIEAKMPSFKFGQIKDRTDVPDWVKENTYWGNDYQRSLVGRVPTAFHLYGWWHLPHDVGYPEMLPAREDVVQSWIKRKNGHTGFKLIYYTNPHLIDSKNSPLYQQYGNEVTSLMANFQPRPFNWAKDITTNYGICASLDIVQDTIVNLQNTLIRDYDADGVYLDEIGTISPDDCYNENHGHPLGTGNRWTQSYNKLIERIMKEGSAIKGSPIVVFMEGPAEPFEALACLDLGITPSQPYAKSALYSGYRIQWAMQYNAYDFEPNQINGIAKMAWTLNGGWQLGWYEYLPSGKTYDDYPEFSLYKKNACLARYSAYQYFNMGEMARPVKIQGVSTVEAQIALAPSANSPYYKVPAVQTSSWNYEGKTALCFTNITNEKQKVSWEGNGKDLLLPEKDSYKISKTFPQAEDFGQGPIKGEFEINPLETVIVIVE